MRCACWVGGAIPLFVSRSLRQRVNYMAVRVRQRSGLCRNLLPAPRARTRLTFNLNFKMPVFWRSDRKPLLFVHVPKAGGSSFSSALVEKGWRELYSIRGLHAAALSFAYCSPQHWHSSILELMFKLDSFGQVVVILRDPFERFMSEYRWQCFQGMTNLSPAEWTSFVLGAYEENPFAFDNHIRPQSDFVIAGASLFQLESFGVARALALCDDQDSSSLSSVTGALGVTSVPHLKRTDDLPGLRDQFESLRSLIMDFYHHDYELLCSLRD